MSKCLAITWVSSGVGTVGIGVYENEFKERSIFCTLATGVSEEVDSKHIGDWGGCIPPCELQRLLDAYNEKKGDSNGRAK